MLQKLLFSLIVCLTICLFTFGVSAAFIQDTQPLPTLVSSSLQSGNSVFLLRDSSLISLDLTTAQQATHLNLPIEQSLSVEALTSASTNNVVSLISVAVDPGAQFLYTVESTARDSRGRTTATRFVQTNVFSEARRVLLDRPGLFSFTFSPDGQRIAISYFEGEYGGSRRYACVLDLASGNCPQINRSLAGNPAVWLDNHTFVLLSEERNLYRVDARTLELRELPVSDGWDILSAVQIPATNSLLISANPWDYTPAPAQFLTLNLDTMIVSDFAYDALDSDYTSVQDWAFSPDGRFLLYGSTFEMALVEFQTGRLISEFEGVIQATWLRDSSGLVFNVGWNRTPSLLEFDLQTRQTRTVIQDSTGIILLG